MKRWDLPVWELTVSADARDLLEGLLTAALEEVAPVVVDEMRGDDSDLAELAADARHLARLGGLLLQLDGRG